MLLFILNPSRNHFFTLFLCQYMLPTNTQFLKFLSNMVSKAVICGKKSIFLKSWMSTISKNMAEYKTLSIKISIQSNLRMRNSKMKSAFKYFYNLTHIVTSFCPNLGKKWHFLYLPIGMS